ncbi:MAG: nucleoside monophosphate kinase [Candidatus Saccharibacteria bacterium]|nr:nucleoside monophosphate kinase [Candidatus Saccharibacteria bacterium]
MEDKLTTIKQWLGTGSINIFGLPMSGKDTQGIRLAEALGAKFLSSGIIIRDMETKTRKSYTKHGDLAPTDIFYKWVLPYFERPDLFEYPLVLSSIGRWHGEEEQVISVAAGAGHEIKAAIILNISEADVERRFQESKVLNDRGTREDDKDLTIFKTRLQEFHQKTLPVLQHYKDLGLLIEVNGDQSREAVFNELVAKLYAKAQEAHA